jgi:hypothetical protein
MLPSYGNTVALSVWESDPSTFIITGGDVESPSVSILNVGDRQTDISRLVFNDFAFTPQELAVI